MDESHEAALRGKRRPGAPIGNTNALKHGRRSRTRGQALKLMAMIQQAHPEWVADPRQIPEPLVALVLALLKRDNSIEEGLTRRNRLQVHLNKAVIESTRQIQSEFEKCGSPFPKTSKTHNQQPSIPARARKNNEQSSIPDLSGPFYEAADAPGLGAISQQGNRLQPIEIPLAKLLQSPSNSVQSQENIPESRLVVRRRRIHRTAFLSLSKYQRCRSKGGGNASYSRRLWRLG